MARPNAAGAGFAAFPPPPAHWRLFRTGGTVGVVPPRIPAGPVVVFGQQHDLEPPPPPVSLDADERLYDAESEDLGDELQRLHASMRSHMLDLLDSLVKCPAEHPREVRQLGQVVKNVASLLFELRQREGRFVVLHQLRNQVARKKEFIETASKALPRLEAQVAELKQRIASQGAEDASVPESSEQTGPNAEVEDQSTEGKLCTAATASSTFTSSAPQVAAEQEGELPDSTSSLQKSDTRPGDEAAGSDQASKKRPHQEDENSLPAKRKAVAQEP